MIIALRTGRAWAAALANPRQRAGRFEMIWHNGPPPRRLVW